MLLLDGTEVHYLAIPLLLYCKGVSEISDLLWPVGSSFGGNAVLEHDEHASASLDCRLSQKAILCQVRALSATDVVGLKYHWGIMGFLILYLRIKIYMQINGCHKLLASMSTWAWRNASERGAMFATIYVCMSITGASSFERSTLLLHVVVPRLSVFYPSLS